MIYLDNAATTKLDPEVLDAMMPFLTEEYGNPGALHKFGAGAAAAVEKARRQVADAAGCGPGNIIFTSGGSEGNNMIVSGMREQLLRSGKTHVLISAVEHDSIRKAAAALSSEQFDVQFFRPDAGNPVIDAETVEQYLRPDTGFASVMYVNNETGTQNDIRSIAELCRQRGILFASDCVQALGLFPVSAERNRLDFASFAAHKIHGPKGTGAVYVSNRSGFAPLIRGGQSQEYGLRGGTENVAGTVGFGKACELAKARMTAELRHVTELKHVFWQVLTGRLDGAVQTGTNADSLETQGKILNFWVDGVQGDSLVSMADLDGVCISAGSACHSRDGKPSETLLAYGVSEERARNSVRVSFSGLNTLSEVETAAGILAENIRKLHSMKGRCGD